jgi:hypothetical protein
MHTAIEIISVLAAYPLWVAWRANRRTTLIHAVGWTSLAWAMWVVALVSRDGAAETAPVRYLALCLTACAVAAVLGARRPGAAAWNFVVGALLAITLLPVAERVFTGGTLRLEWFQALVVGGVLAVGLLNYLPTRLGTAAVLLAAGCWAELVSLCGFEPQAHGMSWVLPMSRLLLALAPWEALRCLWRPPVAASEFDRRWLDFRDRFGLVWGQRLREQFNSAAANAHWPVFLSWQGLRRKDGATRVESEVQEKLVLTLRALMRRFAAPKDAEASCPND